MSTRSLSALVSASLVLLLVACGKKEEAPPAPAADKPAAAVYDTDAEKVVNVYNWSDYIEPTVLEDFTKETGINVNYDVMDSNEMLETKLLAGHTGYDVVVPSASFLARQIKAGVFQKLDKSKLDESQEPRSESCTAKLAVFDPGNEHAVNYMWGTVGRRLQRRQDHRGHEGCPGRQLARCSIRKSSRNSPECGVSVLDAPSEMVGTVLIYLGKDPNSEKPEDLAAAEEGADVGSPVHPPHQLLASTSKISPTARSAWRSAGRGDVAYRRATAPTRTRPAP